MWYEWYELKFASHFSHLFFCSQVEVFLNLKTLTNSGRINDFLPTLLLWTLSALLPIMVAYSDWLMGHWRRRVGRIQMCRFVLNDTSLTLALTKEDEIRFSVTSINFSGPSKICGSCGRCSSSCSSWSSYYHPSD